MPENICKYCKINFMSRKKEDSCGVCVKFKNNKVKPKEIVAEQETTQELNEVQLNQEVVNEDPSILEEIKYLLELQTRSLNKVRCLFYNNSDIGQAMDLLSRKLQEENGQIINISPISRTSGVTTGIIAIYEKPA